MMDLITLESTLEAQSQGQTLAQHAKFSNDTLRVLYAKAVGFYEAGKLDEALPLAYQLVGLDTNHADYWALTGNVLYGLGHFKEAMGFWMVNLSLQPRYATAATVVRTAIALKDKEAAAEALLIASKLKNTSEQIREFDALVDSWYAIS
jgi:tetratricopeptide (TPR) repeat protein